MTRFARHLALFFAALIVGCIWPLIRPVCGIVLLMFYLVAWPICALAHLWVDVGRKMR